MRRALIGAGALVMAYAVAGALGDPDVEILGVLMFLVAVLVLHDGVLLPVWTGIGALIARAVPAAHRAVVQAAVLCSAAVALVALPLVLGYGRRADNPSVLPLPYGRGLLLMLGAVWAAALAAIAVRWIRNRFARTPACPDVADGG